MKRDKCTLQLSLVMVMKQGNHSQLWSLAMVVKRDEHTWQLWSFERDNHTWQLWSSVMVMKCDKDTCQLWISV